MPRLRVARVVGDTPDTGVGDSLIVVPVGDPHGSAAIGGQHPAGRRPKFVAVPGARGADRGLPKIGAPPIGRNGDGESPEGPHSCV
jgi:hypothetical protein